MIVSRKIRFSMLLGIAASMLISTSASARSPTHLHVFNKEQVPLTFTINNINCYESGRKGLSGTTITLQPGHNYNWEFNRVGGHGCNGEQGQFSLTFDPAPPGNTSDIIKFSFSSHAVMSTDSRQVNPYPGKLTLASPKWYYYHSSGLIKKVTAGRAVGSWKNVCREICNYEKTKTISKEESQRKGLDTSETSAISVSLTAGVEMGSFSSESTITSSYEKTVGRSMETAFSSGETNTDTNRYIYTPKQMNDYNFHSIWQWVVPMTLSNGKRYLVRSNHIACMTGHQAPTVAPSDTIVGSCSGALAKK